MGVGVSPVTFEPSSTGRGGEHATGDAAESPQKASRGEIRTPDSLPLQSPQIGPLPFLPM